MNRSGAVIVMSAFAAIWWVIGAGSNRARLAENVRGWNRDQRAAGRR